MARKMEHPNEICAMCGKSKNQVLHLMQGVYGYVCDQCIEEGHEMLSEYAEQEHQKDRKYCDEYDDDLTIRHNNKWYKGEFIILQSLGMHISLTIMEI